MSVVAFAALIAAGYCTESEADQLYAKLEFVTAPPIPSLALAQIDKELADIRETQLKSKL